MLVTVSGVSRALESRRTVGICRGRKRERARASAEASTSMTHEPRRARSTSAGEPAGGADLRGGRVRGLLAQAEPSTASSAPKTTALKNGDEITGALNEEKLKMKNEKFAGCDG